MSLIEVRHFSYTYPGKQEPVLRDITLSIERGSFVVITGASGGGKSTLGKALAGFLFQDEQPNYHGEILVNGLDMSQVPLYDASQHVAYVQQNPEDQFCTLSVVDEIAFGLENYCVDPKEIEQIIDDSLKIVKGLELKERDLATLSGGEKQKIAIASMLALSPDVLILDEPTSNLDPIATQHVFETLYNMRQNQDFTVIIIEHKLAQLQSFNTKIYVLENGEIQPIHDIEDFQVHLSQKTYTLPAIGSEIEKQNKPLIALSNVDIRLGDSTILHDMSFNISQGEFVALMGPNGSGKSTLLQTIMGFHKPEKGNLMIFDENFPSNKISSLVRDVGYIFQNPDHQLFMQSVWDEAILTSKNLGIFTGDQKIRANEFFECLSLGEKRNDHPQRLSYGEKRRLNLLAVLLHQPRLLLIDEFLIGQDMANAHAWMRFFRDYTRQGNTILLVNHHTELTRQYCDRMIFLSEGKILINQPVKTAFDQLSVLNFSSYLPQGRKAYIYE